MTEYVAPPPAGWYPDLELPGQMRWWDGTQWYASLPPQHRPGLGRGFAGIGWTLVGLLAGNALIGAMLFLVNAWGATFPESERILVTDRFAAYDLTALIMLFVLLLALMGTGVLWLVWQYRLARATAPDALRRGAGWHVGAWFIPFISLVWPCQDVRDLWKANVQRKAHGLVGWWWAGFIVAMVAMNVWPSLIDADGQIYSLHDFAVTGAVTGVAWMAAAVLAAVVVARLTRAALLREREAASA